MKITTSYLFQSFGASLLPYLYKLFTHQGGSRDEVSNKICETQLCSDVEAVHTWEERKEGEGRRKGEEGRGGEEGRRREQGERKEKKLV